MTNEAYDWYVERWPTVQPASHPVLRLVQRLSWG
jgi:hypothetical protein